MQQGGPDSPDLEGRGMTHVHGTTQMLMLGMGNIATMITHSKVHDQLDGRPVHVHGEQQVRLLYTACMRELALTLTF
jgi:hypothetical protein